MQLVVGKHVADPTEIEREVTRVNQSPVALIAHGLPDDIEINVRAVGGIHFEPRTSRYDDDGACDVGFGGQEQLAENLGGLVKVFEHMAQEERAHPTLPVYRGQGPVVVKSVVPANVQSLLLAVLHRGFVVLDTQ